MPPTRRIRATQDPDTSTTPIADTQSIVLHGHDRVEPLDAEDRAVQAALKVLQELGYGIAMRCVDCQHPITTPASLRRMRGAHCHARHEAEAKAVR